MDKSNLVSPEKTKKLNSISFISVGILVLSLVDPYMMILGIALVGLYSALGILSLRWGLLVIPLLIIDGVILFYTASNLISNLQYIYPKLIDPPALFYSIGIIIVFSAALLVHSRILISYVSLKK
jgi:hypothetical protein